MQSELWNLVWTVAWSVVYLAVVVASMRVLRTGAGAP